MLYTGDDAEHVSHLLVKPPGDVAYPVRDVILLILPLLPELGDPLPGQSSSSLLLYHSL